MDISYKEKLPCGIADIIPYARGLIANEKRAYIDKYICEDGTTWYTAFVCDMQDNQEWYGAYHSELNYAKKELEKHYKEVYKHKSFIKLFRGIPGI